MEGSVLVIWVLIIYVSAGSLVLKEWEWDASDGSRWKSLMLLCMFSLHAAYPVVVQQKASDMRLGSLQGRKKYDAERVRCGEGPDARRRWNAEAL